MGLNMLTNGIYAVKGFDIPCGDVEDGPCPDYNTAKTVAIKILCDKSDDYFVAWCKQRKHYWVKKVPGPHKPGLAPNLVLFFKGKIIGSNIIGVRGWDMPCGDVHESAGNFEQAKDYIDFA